MYSYHQMRYPPAPYSPPPSPPKSKLLPIRNDFTTEISNKALHLNYPYSYYSNNNNNPSVNSCSVNCSHSPRVAQHYMNYDVASYPYHDKPSTTTTSSQIESELRTNMSRMSISYINNPHDDDDDGDEEYAPTTTDDSTTEEFGKEIDRKVYAGRKRRCRKNPYPMKAPSRDSPGISLKVNAYNSVIKDPASILRSNETFSPSSTNSVFSSDLQSSSSSSTLLNDPSRKQSSKTKKTTAQKKNKEIKIRQVTKPERKRKGNSLARVMTDRGFVLNADAASTDNLKATRIPPPPQMQFHELMAAIRDLNIDHSVLNDNAPDITWKGLPLNIAHLPHYKELHEAEAKVVSILRLTPVQYLTGKHTLVSTARRYVQRSLPFKKSDAQKLLRIDVNKASKLWEFFRHVKWI